MDDNMAKISLRKVGKIYRKIKAKSIQSSIVPLTAHIASVITIILTWFVKNGDFNFEATKFFDWIVLIICIYISIAGCIDIIKAVKYPRFALVNRKELSYLINVARDKARTSIINVSGDLSWLNDDFEALQIIRQKSKHLVMKIYFNPQKISEKLLPKIILLHESGINMIPYDIEKELSVKCMMIDNNSEEDRKLFLYPKMEHGKIIRPKDNDFFMWKQVDNDKFLLDSIASLINIMESRKRPIRIGISGINNVGKTHLFKKCIDILRKNFSIKGFDDEFKKYNNTDLNTNYIILMNQIINQMYITEEICFYDRTTIDNYYFMLIQNKPTKSQMENLFMNLKNVVDNSMKNIDLVIFVQQKDNKYYDTKHVTSINRNKINNHLQQYYEINNIKQIVVEISNDNFDTDINTGAIKIIDMVKQLYFSNIK
jgi:hypothetical protein